MKSTFWLAALVFFAASGFIQGEDEVVLKSGERMKGTLRDASETPESVTIKIVKKPGIITEKQIPKADIQEIIRSQGEDEAAYKLKLGENSVAEGWYVQAIEKQIKPWLAKYPQSKLVSEMTARQKEFADELERVRKGEHRIGTQWYTAEEYPRVKMEEEAKGVLSQIQSAATVSDYCRVMELTKKAQENCTNALAFADILQCGRQALASPDPAKATASLRKALERFQQEMTQTVFRVQAIVNQVPATCSPPEPGEGSKIVGLHEGAIKPDFNTVDVSKSQDAYEKYSERALSVEGAPNVYYLCKDCEFNIQLKYFYTRRDLAKKKLTTNEMQEINRLYRILGNDEKQIVRLQNLVKDPGLFLMEITEFLSKLPAAKPPLTAPLAPVTGSTNAPAQPVKP
jgi:hypothetical protein